MGNARPVIRPTFQIFPNGQMGEAKGIGFLIEEHVATSIQEIVLG
jgi:hypothetical protein